MCISPYRLAGCGDAKLLANGLEEYPIDVSSDRSIEPIRKPLGEILKMK
jgi:hypothetical protein